MKKSSFWLLASIIILGLSVSSCKKDPKLSDQVVGDWTSSKVTYDSTDATSLFSYTIIISSNKSFDLTQRTPLTPGSTVRKGTWETDDSRNEVLLHYDDSSETDRYDISGLTSAQMTAETVLNGKRLIIQFRK